jgi:hypothetical protein
MCWQCDHPGRPVQAYLDELNETMMQHGWAVQYVESDLAPFAYTLGLTRYDLPELLITGVSAQRAGRLLNGVARRCVGLGALVPGAQFAVPSGPLIEVVEVDHPDAHLNFAVAFFGREIRALQLVWADRRGRWPWAEEFNRDFRGRDTQPVLGMRAPCDLDESG